VPGRASLLTRSGEAVERKMTGAPEREDRLDAATDVVVNGPEDASFDWQAIDWRQVEDDVRRLRQRIFTASKAGVIRGDGTPGKHERRLTHAHCRQGSGQALLPAYEPTGLA
jgi:hypothetical protein